MEEMNKDYDPDMCSFCGGLASDNDMKALIRGPMVNICSDCVDVCVLIIDDYRYYQAILMGIERR